MKIKLLFTALLAISFANSFAQVGKSTWGKTNYDDTPWVKNVSRPNEITEGLQNRHLSVWSSHGKYYDANKGGWKWQRPILFCTTEDLYTQTIVLPYLIPMLENAGAIVFTPRERNWQKNEIIVDSGLLHPQKVSHYIMAAITMVRIHLQQVQRDKLKQESVTVSLVQSSINQPSLKLDATLSM